MSVQPLSRQEIFSKVTRHLLTQKEQSLLSYSGSLPGCMYRGPRGLQCAIGCLIADEYYSEHLEGHYVRHPLVVRALEESGVDVSDEYQDTFALLAWLQAIHDESHPSRWEEGLRSLASRHDLHFDWVDTSVVS